MSSKNWWYAKQSCPGTCTVSQSPFCGILALRIDFSSTSLKSQLFYHAAQSLIYHFSLGHRSLYPIFEKELALL